MAYNKNFPSDAGIQIGIIASGGDPDSGDHPSDHSSNMKVASPLEHGSGVSPDHLAFSTMMVSPDSASQRQFKGALAPGTPVLFLKTGGQSGGVILGQLNGINNASSGRTPGNMDLMQVWSQFPSMDMGISNPPRIQETTERGAKVRKVQETGEMFSLDTLQGLPIHGALFDMTGYKLPEVKKVPTAKQNNTKMMTQNMMDQLPGQLMSLGQMFQGLKSKGASSSGSAGGGYGSQSTPYSETSNNSVTFDEPTYMDSIMSSLPNQQMKDAVTSLSRLVQGQELNGGVAYVTDGIVHEGTYLENARDLLSQVETISDLMYVLSRLQWDTSLFGREKLDTVETEIETAWGVALQQVDVDGEIVVTYANTANSLAQINAFSEMISSNTGAPSIGSTPAPSSGGSGGGGGGGGGAGNIAGKLQGMIGNMFGKSSGVIQEMMKRLHPQGEQTAKQLQQKVNQGSSQQKMKQISEATIKGQGDPTDKGFYDISFM
jgi:hypothetical protein